MIMSSLIADCQNMPLGPERAGVNSLLGGHVYTLLVDTTGGGSCAATEERHVGSFGARRVRIVVRACGDESETAKQEYCLAWRWSLDERRARQRRRVQRVMSTLAISGTEKVCP